MKRLKNILTILTLCVTLTSCVRSIATETKKDTYRALAKLVSLDGGDKLHLATFQIIKDLSGSNYLSDRIIVGFYNYKQPDNNLDSVLLTIQKYDGPTTLKNYFICEDYDGKIGIQKVKIDFINFDYWERCETGESDCKPLNFARKKSETNWFLFMPCGGTETTISISGQNFKQELHFHHDNCPPHLDLSNLKDGNYVATMRACGLGGTVTFNLTTKK